MACCVLASLALASTASWLARLKAILAVAMLGLAIAGLWHLGHYTARAQASERTLLAELMARPICSGAPAAAINQGGLQ